ncbi:hypothetical protein RRG08_059349 [Elysia crispata]|uniref:Uncharacterized protein n=1 Tax=Elysia crispata TaxID=231223 RepID=A0AAE1BEE2_9GAST|nr:hypothetical protein RRG08_059349 [Elysia crispata]
MVGESLKVAGKPSRFLAVSINIMGSECISSWEEDSIELLVWLLELLQLHETNSHQSLSDHIFNNHDLYCVLIIGKIRHKKNVGPSEGDLDARVPAKLWN